MYELLYGERLKKKKIKQYSIAKEFWNWNLLSSAALSNWTTIIVIIMCGKMKSDRKKILQDIY